MVEASSTNQRGRGRILRRFSLASIQIQMPDCLQAAAVRRTRTGQQLHKSSVFVHLRHPVRQAKTLTAQVRQSQSDPPRFRFPAWDETASRPTTHTPLFLFSRTPPPGSSPSAPG